MKIFPRCIVLALALIPIAADVAMAKTKPIIKPQKPRVVDAALVTRDNFVSLKMMTSGGIANLQSEVVLQGRTISWKRDFPRRGGYSGSGIMDSYSPPAIAGISEKQFDGLLNALNQAHFEKLAGNYRQKNLADGINETLVLTISDEKNRDRSFVVKNYGDTAPPDYSKFTAWLGDFIAMKFPQPTAVASPDSPPHLTR